MSENEKVHAKRLLIFFGVLIGLGVVASYFIWGPLWYQNYAPEQPIPFSHQMHAGDREIPCLYCHSNAEHEAFASVPDLDTCMGCHASVATDRPAIQKLQQHYEQEEPIVWQKVHILPDFVHFNHSRHLSAGLECADCHGPVESMEVVYQWAPLTMKWCVDCHRSDDYLQPHRVELYQNEVALRGGERPDWFQALSHSEMQNADVSCSNCHY